MATPSHPLTNPAAKAPSTRSLPGPPAMPPGVRYDPCSDDAEVARGPRPPNHTPLPEGGDSPVPHFLERPQSMLLSDAILPVLQQRQTDGLYALGQNVDIYWRWADPPSAGCKSPDWFCVTGLLPLENELYRRSYMLGWKHIVPHMLLEFVSGDGREERDRTPWRGKFWVYERMMRAPSHAIFDPQRGELEVHRLETNRYQLMTANAHGRYEIASLDLELGLWRGEYCGITLTWLCWRDQQGVMLPTGHERAEQQKRRAEQAERQAAAEKDKAKRLAARLRALDIAPEST